MVTEPPRGISTSEQRTIQAVTMRAYQELRGRLVAYWQESEKSGIDPGWSPHCLINFEKDLFSHSLQSQPAWLTAFGDYAVKCFDARAETAISRFNGATAYGEHLRECVVLEVCSLIEGPAGLWPAIMAETRQAAGYFVRDDFAQFVQHGFTAPGEHVRSRLADRIAEWGTRHAERLSAELSRPHPREVIAAFLARHKWTEKELIGRIEGKFSKNTLAKIKRGDTSVRPDKINALAAAMQEKEKDFNRDSLIPESW